MATNLNAFKSKNDYYGLGSLTNVEIVGTTENKSAQVAEAQGEDGFVVADLVYGEKSAPVCEYAVKGDVSLGTINLGTINEIDNKSFVMTEITVGTGAGQAPTLAASGQQIEDNATVACTASLAGISINGLHHAQTFGAFTIGGQGAHLTQSNFTATAQVSTAEKDGDIIAHDITDGRITVNGTVVVADNSYPTPTLSAASGWVVTAPLTETNSNASFPTYSFTITKYLTGTEPS